MLRCREVTSVNLKNRKTFCYLRTVVLKLIEGTEPRKFYSDIHQTLRWKLKYSQIKSFIILTVLRRSVLRVFAARLRVIAPGHRSFFQENVTAVASRWQHCV